MSLYTAAAARLRITSGGIVLINDANVSSNRADAPLQIETGANGNALNLRAREGDNIYSYLNFQNNAGSQTAAHIYLQRDASTNAGTLVFGTAAANANTPTERLHITSAGRVGIGDASPDTKLTVKAGSGDQLRLDNSGERYTQISLRNNGSQKAAIWFDNTNNQFDIYGSTNVGIKFLTGGSEKVRITSAGEVRISNTDMATSTSADELIIGPNTPAGDRGLTIFSGTSGTGNIFFGDTDTNEVGNRMGTITYDHSGNFMRFSTNGNNERLRITSGGVVNIGGDYTQTTYQAQITGDLLIQKDQAAYQHPQIELYALNTGAYGGAVKFTGNVAGTKYTQATIRTYGGGNTSDGSLAFFTGANTEKLRITSGGALNIGTGVESGAVENLVELYVGGNDGSHATIRGKYNRTNEYNRSEVRFGVEQNASGLGFLAFATGNNSASERMRITSAGKVAINDITPDTTLTVNGSINVEAGVFGKRFTGLTTVDTGFMVGSTGTWSSAVLEVIVSGNPNHLGSGYYRASSTYLVHIGTGWTGSTLYNCDSNKNCIYSRRTRKL